MAARGHFVFPIDDKNHRVLVIWDLNGYGEYEFDRCICEKVIACATKNIISSKIFKFRGYNKAVNACVDTYTYIVVGILRCRKLWVLKCRNIGLSKYWAVKILKL